MIIGTILLSQNDCFVDDRKNLPQGRPQWDKELLKTYVSLNTISREGYKLLPPSIQAVAKVTRKEPELAITIQELDALPDILYVVRSSRMTHGGKKFRLDNYEPILKELRFEVWKRKTI